MKYNMHTDYTYDGRDNFKIYDIETPTECPRCHRSIVPLFVSAAVIDKDQITVTYFCEGCSKCFLTDYGFSKDKSYGTYSATKPTDIYPENFEPEVFDNTILSVSPIFVEIYNQAKASESYNLDQISGVGYRKALEFLVKDYAKYLNSDDPDKIDQIENMSLVQCIERYIPIPKMKDVLKRAAWLGNDETHYIRKYTDHDIETLKTLIKLSHGWITIDLDSSKYTEAIVHPSELQNQTQD